MKKIFLFFTLILSIAANAQIAWNMTLLSHYEDPNLARIGYEIWNDCEGYFDSLNKKEYAIAGSVDSIYFFDITNSSIMKKCDVEGGISHAVNRDFEIYDHYVYCVSDNIASGTSQGKMQIFDLQYLPDSVHKVYESNATGSNTHTIKINKKSKRLYKCINRYGTDSNTISLINAMEIYSLKDPLNPTLLAKLKRGDYNDVHESFVNNDTVFCSDGNAGLFIYDMNDTSNIVPFGSIQPPYPDCAYNHSSWLDSSGKYLLFTDETPDGKGMKIYDVSDISTPRIIGGPFKNYGSPHNVFWVGRYAFVSMYYGGVNVYDMKNIYAPNFVAYYRTFPYPHTANVYEGCWGVYPFLPSGNIIASDMVTGIYLLKLNLAVNETALSSLRLSCYPNPFNKNVIVNISSTEKEVMHLFIYDLQSKIVAERMVELETGNNEIYIDQLQNSANGMFIVRLISATGVYHQTIIKQ